MHTHCLHAAYIRHVQPHQRQSNATFRVGPSLARSGVHGRSCIACVTTQADAPACNVKAAQPVRYRGVRTSSNKYDARIQFQGKNHYLGVYETPEEAARAFDEARIFLKREPVNFPKSQYDEAAILQIPDFATFVERMTAIGRLNAKPTKTCRYVGVSFCMRSCQKYRASIKLEGRRHHLGMYRTPEEAARIYDEARISLKKEPVNFPKSQYDEAILQIPDFDTFLRQQKATGKLRTKSSSYIGVQKPYDACFPYHARILTSDMNLHLGKYETEDQAARSYDECCIYLGHKPVNFPNHPYDQEDICKPADLAEFVQRSREVAARLVKSRQTSRFTGVSWNRNDQKWGGICKGATAHEEETHRVFFR
ncbi:hypothetical protein ABBQ38_013114 [Trebouxia sp. C0009 RCD-2024]